ncbi:MAG: AEC family transporter [Ruminiclostridium sp.]|nr:AEC family transporter [Ruminiclostridium sp.]
MSFNIVLNQVLILFIILIIGFVAGKTGIIAGGASKKLSELLLYITSPMLVLGSFFFEYSAEKMRNALLVLLYGSGLFLFSILISAVLFKNYDSKVKPILRFTAVFSNCGFMGLPMMKALFGDDGVFLGSFYVGAFNFFVWTFGLAMFSDIKEHGGMRNSLKKALLNPALIAVYLGVIIFILQIPVPDVIRQAVNYVGDMTLPLSMLIIGALISTARFSTLFNDLKVYYASAVRLILLPLAAFGILSLIGAPKMVTSIVVTAAAMPIAANTTIFAEMFDKDSVFASKAVVLSTILSIIPAPLIISLIG